MRRPAAPAAADNAATTGARARARTENEVHRQQRWIAEALGFGPSRELDEPRTDAEACLLPILLALNWAGEHRHIKEALPHFDDLADTDSLRAVLVRLNIETRRTPLGLADLDDEMLPAIHTDAKGGIWIVISREEPGQFLAYSGAARDFRFLSARSGGDNHVVVHSAAHASDRAPTRSWLFGLVRRFRPTIASLLVVSLAINFLALVVPLFVMTVYDRVVPTKSAMTLAYLVAGIATAVIGEILIRRLRSRALAYFGARLEALVSISVIERLLFMPIQMTESAPVANQTTRIKQFEVMRDLFIGPLATVLFDLPFLIVAFAMIVLIGGPIAWVPACLVALLAMLGAVSSPSVRRRQQDASVAHGADRQMLTEIVTRIRSVREIGGEAEWIDRYREVAAKAARERFRAQQFASTVQMVAQTMTTGAGIMAMGIGAAMAFEGDITIGALIAVVALIWRVMAPVQGVFVGIGKLNQALDSVRQIDHLMRIQVEREPGQLPSLFRSHNGHISAARVSFRYSNLSEAALAGITLDIPHGELVAITGASGAGKSTLLKLIVGLYRPQGGVLAIDGVDVRQYDVGELRHSVSYLPQQPDFFYGTIAQNLRLAHPEAGDDDIWRALDQVGLGSYVEALPDGIDTRLGAGGFAALPRTVRQQLALARAFVKRVPIYLMDEPERGLNPAADEALAAWLRANKGHATIIMATHRPSHIRLADRVIVLKDGQIADEGPPGKVLSAPAA